MQLLIVGLGGWAVESVTPLGHAVARAATASDALDLIDRMEEASDVDAHVGMVCVDGVAEALPVLAGIDERAPSGEARVPVLVMCDGEDDQRAAWEAGADQVFSSKMTPEAMRARIGALLRHRASELSIGSREAELARRGQRLDDLLRCLAHDLKNPLGVVQANVEYAMTRLPECDDDVGDSLRDAEEAARATLGLIEDLSVLARDDDQKLTVSSRLLELRALVEEVRISCARSASDRRVTMDLLCAAGVQVQADGRLLRRAIENLVEHAVRQAGSGGRVRIQAGVEGDRVTIVVSRTGRSVDDADRAVLFDRFARLGGARFGPGLGLYYSRRIAESHGGLVHFLEGRDFPENLVLEIPGAVVPAAVGSGRTDPPRLFSASL